MELPRAACVVGWPASHSRSPLIHKHWIERYGIAGDYRRESVPPEDLAAFFGNLAQNGYVGANVTLPHKEAVLAFTEPDDRAAAVGAANTVWLSDGRLRSTNTDVEGFLANLDACVPDWDADVREAVVLGAGGAARAVVFGLLARGLKRVHIVNRTAGRAQSLVEQFGQAVHLAPWVQVQNLLARSQLLVNTTVLGMRGQDDLVIDLDPLSRGAIVADVVYAPLVTPLLKEARVRGLRTADGLGMLLHQAVRGFSLWFGVTPEVTPELRRLVEQDLGQG